MYDKAHIEAEAKFKALYLGQPVYKREGQPLTYYLRVTHLRAEDKGYLSLRTVKQLTDEEYKVLAKWSAYRLDNKNIVQVGKAMAKHLFELNKWSGNTISAMVDYLRSIGILLPFTTTINGEVKTYEVEEILANGWYKTVQ